MGQFHVGALEWKCILCNISGARKRYLRLYIFLLLFVTGSTQQVQLMPFDKANTGCDDGGVIDGKGQVVMTGFVTAVGANPSFQFLKSRDGGGSFNPDCTISISSSGSCVSQSTAPCYCQSVSGNNYTVVYNITADLRDSNAILALRYSSVPPVTQAMPVVHGVEQVSVTYSGAASPILLSVICNENFSPGKAHNFEICARNLEDAEFFIGIDASVGTWLTAINNCSTFKDVKFQDTESLTFAYRETTGCQREDSLNCTISESSGGGGCELPCILGICIPVGVLLIAAIVWFCCWKYCPVEGVTCCCFASTCCCYTSTCCCKRKSICCFNKTPKFCGHTSICCCKETYSCCCGMTSEVTIIISVDASRKELEKKVKEQLSKGDQNTLTEPLKFKYEGTEMGPEENWRLKELLPECRGDLVLIVIVLLDGSHLCEIKKAEAKAPPRGPSSKGNNQVTQM